MKHVTEFEVSGPWSLATSRAFWEGFAPAALGEQSHAALTTTFLVDSDWTRAEANVQQIENRARIEVSGDGDLDAATRQVSRFLSLDVDASGWLEVGERDPVMGEVQQQLSGLRPCGFHSPYEAAAWAVLSQRIRIAQAATLRQRVISEHGEGGAFPTPAVLRTLDIDLPGRKLEYLHSVAEAALDGMLDGAALRNLEPEAAAASVREITGIGPFAAELIVLRGANAPDALPHHEARLTDEIAVRYGPDAELETIAELWRPLRTWACVYLRSAREARTGEISNPRRARE